MQQGFSAVKQAVDALDVATVTPTDVFNTAARVFLNAVGASSGPLYATALMRAGATLRGKTAASGHDLAALVPAMTRGIADRGKAAPGDKTMLDTWSSSSARVEAMLDAGAEPAAILAAAIEAAEAGAQSTIAMEARMGRAARLGARSVGNMDAGAASAAVLIKAMLGSFVA